MFIIVLRFADNRRAAPSHAAGHDAWICRGLAEGSFLLVGSLPPGQGGAILAHAASLADLERRVAADPFVAAGVVTAEILAVTPSRTDPRLDFLRVPPAQNGRS